MAEVKTGTDNQHCVDIATATYKEAHQLVLTHLCPTDPVFLGTLANFADTETKMRCTVLISYATRLNSLSSFSRPPGIVLNYSVFFHEHLKNPTEAIRIAQKTFDDAVAELDAVTEERHRDAAFILKIMRENLEFWQSKTIRKAP